MFKFFVCALFVILTGCGEAEVTEGRMDNIVRVFWHQGARYSALVDLKNNTHQMRSLPSHAPCGGWEKTDETVSIISDVAPNNPMWALWKIKDEYSGLCVVEIKIHVHTPKDIGQGPWTCGKATCQTSAIE